MQHCHLSSTVESSEGFLFIYLRLIYPNGTDCSSVVVKQKHEPSCVGLLLCYLVPQWSAFPASSICFAFRDLHHACAHGTWCSFARFISRGISKWGICVWVGCLGVNCQVVITKAEVCQGSVCIPKSQNDSKSSSCAASLACLDV